MSKQTAVLTFAVVLSVIVAPALVAQGKPSTAITVEKVNKLGEGRYTAAEPFQVNTWEVFGEQPRYDPAKPEMLDGWQTSTAGQLGITDGWNEVGNNVVARVALRPDEPLLYMGDVFYLTNCKWFIKGEWKEFKNRFKPITPPPPATAPSPTPAPVAQLIPLPVCEITGDYLNGFEGRAEYGEGQFYLDEQMMEGATVGLDIIDFEGNKTVTHTVKFTVKGPGGTVDCRQRFDLYKKIKIVPAEIISTLPHIGFCDSRYGWGDFLKGMAYPIVCEPGQTLTISAIGAGGGWALGRAFPKGIPKVLAKDSGVPAPGTPPGLKLP